MVMKEYWGKPDETAEAFAGGWFHSGDLVRQDEEGYFYVVDRKKDMIISGGENIYCAEVENVLAGAPEGRRGRADRRPRHQLRRGAAGRRRARATPPTRRRAEELAAWCREKLARYKNPREYSIVGALPRNPSGKVLKTPLRQEHSAGSLVASPAV